jgi:hypothetical protein
MQVSLIRENEDGSADVTFDLTGDEKEALIRYGILEALKAAIKEGEKLMCEGRSLDEGKELDE